MDTGRKHQKSTQVCETLNQYCILDSWFN